MATVAGRPVMTSRVALAGLIGNALEWYDFGLYGLLAPVLASRFFAAGDRTAALLGVYGGFAAGFAMRPVGALVLGRIGDRRGRRPVLVASIALMGLATASVAFLPGYRTLGVWAAVLLVATRLLQGFSVGGEFVGSVTYLVEAAPQRRRGFAGSLANLGATVGMLLAAAIAALVTRGGGHAAAWAWRLAFLGGGLLALLGLRLRRHLPETADVSGLSAAGEPLRLVWRNARGVFLWAVAFTSGYGIVNYLTMVFLPVFAHEFGHAGESQALRVNAAGQALALLLVPAAGWVSDVWLRRRTLLGIAFLIEAAFAAVAFRWAASASAAGLWAAQLGVAALLSLVMGAAPAMLAEQFGAAYRVSAHAVAFNLGIGIAGGAAPLVAVALIRWTGAPLSPAWFLAAAALLAACAALALPDRSRAPLAAARELSG
jgi:MHS family proline/betaine transporter-like MFS transporter